MWAFTQPIFCQGLYPPEDILKSSVDKSLGRINYYEKQWFKDVFRGGEYITFEQYVYSNNKQDSVKTKWGQFRYFWSREGTDSKKIPRQGRINRYAERSSIGGIEKGNTLESHVYRFKGGKLDGLQSFGNNRLNRTKNSEGLYDGFDAEWVDNYYSPAIINGNIVGLQSGEKGFQDKSEMNKSIKSYKTKFQQFASTCFDENPIEFYDLIGNLKVFEENQYYELETMVNLFLSDVMATKTQYYLENPIGAYKQKVNLNEISPFSRLSSVSINATFEPLEKNEIARAYGIDNDNQIILKVDPDKWMLVNSATRWYILYHELGHDFFNLRHGQGGRMMFNYPTEMYDWVDFFEDRDFMFEYFFTKLDPEYEPPRKIIGM